jgi:hypothetical protein
MLNVSRHQQNILDAQRQRFKVAANRQSRSLTKKSFVNDHCKSSTSVALLSSVLMVAGCSTTHNSPYQPGPVAGERIGNGVGVVGGNVVGFGVGAVEGTAAGFAAPFDPDYHMVRYWRTETTSDGRTIQVPYDILVDQYGRPKYMPAPTGNPAPPPVATGATNSPAK